MCQCVGGLVGGCAGVKCDGLTFPHPVSHEISPRKFIIPTTVSVMKKAEILGGGSVSYQIS